VLKLGSVGEVEEQAASPINPPKTNHRVVAIVVSSCRSLPHALHGQLAHPVTRLVRSLLLVARHHDQAFTRSSAEIRLGRGR
jgi:hypothetical protein